MCGFTSPRTNRHRMRSRWLTTAAALSSTLVTGTTWACPSCPVGRTARQQVWEQGFAHNLLIAIAPFILVGLACLWAERIGKDAKHTAR